MKTFIDKGIVTVVTVDGNEMHYDTILQEHGHFRCVECGKLFNFQIDPHLQLVDTERGWTVQERNIYLKGICDQCKADTRSSYH